MWQPTTIGNQSAGFLPAVVDYAETITLIRREHRFKTELEAIEVAIVAAKIANAKAKEYLEHDGYSS